MRRKKCGQMGNAWRGTDCILVATARVHFIGGRLERLVSVSFRFVSLKPHGRLIYV